MQRHAFFMLIVALVLTGGWFLIGCSEQDQQEPGQAGMTFINARCPIMQDNAIDPANVPDDLIVEFRGHKVAFCCGGCPDKWQAMSDAERKASLIAVGVEPEKLE
jgi:hypothetical protein